MVTRWLVVLAVATALFIAFAALRGTPGLPTRTAAQHGPAPTSNPSDAPPASSVGGDGATHADTALAAAGAASVGGARSARVDAEQGCALVVRVVERTSRAPLERALVEVTARAARRAEYTGADGRVAFDGLPEGPAQVWIDARGAPAGTMRLLESAGSDGGILTGGWASGVVLARTDTTAEVELELVALVTVRGHATLDGQPLAGSTVFAIALGGDPVAIDPTATVADDGSFELADVAVGRVAFHVEPPTRAHGVGAVHEDLPAREHTVPPGPQHEVRLAWSTADRTRVRGRAVDAFGRPLAGVGVALMRLDARASDGADGASEALLGSTDGGSVRGLDPARVAALLAGPAPRIADPTEVGFGERSHMPSPFPPDVDVGFEGDPRHPTLFLSTDGDGTFEFAMLAPGTWRLDVEAHHPNRALHRELVRAAPWVAYDTSVCGVVDTNGARVWDVGDVVVPRLEIVCVTGRVDVRGVSHDHLLPGTYSILGSSHPTADASGADPSSDALATPAEVSRREHTYTWLGVHAGSAVCLDLWGPLPAHRRPSDGSPLARVELPASAFASQGGVLTAHHDFVVDGP